MHTILFMAAVALVLVLVPGAWLFGGRKHRATARHARRLAFEITGVAGTIRADSARIANPALKAWFGDRCSEDSREAVATLLHRGELRAADKEALRRTVLRLHEDHHRIVGLRCELDAALSVRAPQSHPGSAGQMNFPVAAM